MLTGPQEVAVAVVDHETCVRGKDTWPTSWTWTDPDTYLTQVEELAAGLADQGAAPVYCFIDPAEYVEWCRETGHEVDSSDTRAIYAGQLAQSGEGIPYDPAQPLWPIGVTSMVVRSEVEVDGSTSGPVLEFIRMFIDLVVQHPGTWRTIVTASRFHDHDQTEMWAHFQAAVDSRGKITFCGEYLSAQETIRHHNRRLHIPDHGDPHPMEVLLRLAAGGHGIAGIEHRDGDAFTFRAWNVTSGAELVEVAADEFPPGFLSRISAARQSGRPARRRQTRRKGRRKNR